jgi:predicted RNA binding protein YcfA (HicA-like mRNA interferase family)
VTRLPRITAKQMISALKRGGWVMIGTRGAHVQMKHPARPGKVTIPGHAGMTLMPNLVSSIIDQAGLTSDELISLL